MDSQKSSRTRILITVACLCLTALAAAQNGKLSPEKKAAIESAVSKFMAANAVPGVSVAVVEGGEYEWSAGFGAADLENFVPATSQTLYRLASVSKPITATAAMLLWQQGKLDLDAPVQKYCPAFPEKTFLEKAAPITTRQLLGHLAGIRHYKGDSPDDPEVFNIRHFENPIQGGLQFFKDDALLSKPGEAFHYTTHGYTVAGCVIEGASSDNYVDYVRKNVLQPAGMTHTIVDNRYKVIPFRTRFYQKDKAGQVENADFLDSSYKIPGGGWLSSADDMANFEVALLKDAIVKRESRNLMWTPLKTGDGKDDGYGLGWGTGEVSGVSLVGHSGGQQGTSTYIALAPRQQAGVVILTNIEHTDATELGRQVMTILAGAKPN